MNSNMIAKIFKVILVGLAYGVLSFIFLIIEPFKKSLNFVYIDNLTTIPVLFLCLTSLTVFFLFSKNKKQVMLFGNISSICFVFIYIEGIRILFPSSEAQSLLSIILFHLDSWYLFAVAFSINLILAFFKKNSDYGSVFR